MLEHDPADAHPLDPVLLIDMQLLEVGHASIESSVKVDNTNPLQNSDLLVAGDAPAVSETKFCSNSYPPSLQLHDSGFNKRRIADEDGVPETVLKRQSS